MIVMVTSYQLKQLNQLFFTLYVFAARCRRTRARGRGLDISTCIFL